jgi:hypothetical protein
MKSLPLALGPVLNAEPSVETLAPGLIDDHWIGLSGSGSSGLSGPLSRAGVGQNVEKSISMKFGVRDVFPYRYFLNNGLDCRIFGWLVRKADQSSAPDRGILPPSSALAF